MGYYFMLTPKYQGKAEKSNAQWLEECKELQYQHLASYVRTPSQESTAQEWLLRQIPDPLKTSFAADYTDAKISSAFSLFLYAPLAKGAEHVWPWVTDCSSLSILWFIYTG